MSEAGIGYRSKRPIELKAVFGHIKKYGKLRRSSPRRIERASLEFGIKAPVYSLIKLVALTLTKLFSHLFFCTTQRLLKVT